MQFHFSSIINSISFLLLSHIRKISPDFPVEQDQMGNENNFLIPAHSVSMGAKKDTSETPVNVMQREKSNSSTPPSPPSKSNTLTKKELNTAPSDATLVSTPSEEKTSTKKFEPLKEKFVQRRKSVWKSLKSAFGSKDNTFKESTKSVEGTPTSAATTPSTPATVSSQ